VVVRAWTIAFAALLAISGCSDDTADESPTDTDTDTDTGAAPPSDSDDGGAPESPEPNCLAAGAYEASVEVDGVVHRYEVLIPAAAVAPAPAVLLFHGGGSTGAAMQTVSELDAVAEREGFVLVTIEGFDIGRQTQVWNAGACCGPTAAVDHVAAVSAILDQAIADGACIDEQRVYATGHSNGAMMSHRLACELSDRIAAIAASAGGLMNTDLRVSPPTDVFACAPGRAVPVLHVHGLDDTCVPYAGGLTTGNSDAVHPAAEDMIAGWRTRNGCDDDAIDVTEGAVRRRTWACRDGAEVELIAVAGLGHAWAGSPIYGNPDICGGTTSDALSTTEELWRFFQRH